MYREPASREEQRNNFMYPIKAKNSIEEAENG